MSFTTDLCGLVDPSVHRSHQVHMDHVWLDPWFLPVYTLCRAPCPQESSCLPCAVNICPSTTPLLWEIDCFCWPSFQRRVISASCILKTCRRNMISLPRTWIICFQLNLDRKAVKCVRENWRIQEVLKAREQQCYRKRKPVGKRNITEGSVKWKPGGVAKSSEHLRLTTG